MFNILKNTGLKITKPRIAVLKVLGHEKYPLSVEKLYKKTKKHGMDLATVYRTIDAFERKGLVRRVNIDKDASSYELQSTRHHHHIICTKCQTIEDFENETIEDLLKKISRNSLKFKNITDHSLELFGLCRMCALKC